MAILFQMTNSVFIFYVVFVLIFWGYLFPKYQVIRQKLNQAYLKLSIINNSHSLKEMTLIISDNTSKYDKMIEKKDYWYANPKIENSLLKYPIYEKLVKEYYSLYKKQKLFNFSFFLFVFLLILIVPISA